MKSEFGAPKELTSILQRKNRKINMRQKDLNFLDRNEFNYSPSKEVVEALKNFDINKLCFYTRIYDEGKKSILSVFLSELYDIDETQVLLGYGGEDILKQAVHYFLTEEDGNKTMLIPKFSWWYYKSIADEVNGRTLQYPLYEDGNTFKYDFAAMKDMIQKENPKILRSIRLFRLNRHKIYQRVGEQISEFDHLPHFIQVLRLAGVTHGIRFHE